MGIDLWSLSPRNFNGSNANVFIVNNDGNLNNTNVNNTNGAVAPVISLKAEYAAQLTGQGTSGSPFQLPGVQ